jgi:diguanylate cyclase (GGDEF)-like protein
VLGDQSLRTIAQTMLTFLRPDDHAARLIGNKFAVLLSNLSLANACATAERLRSAISQTPIVLPDGNELPPFTISAGVSEALPDDTWNTFIARADISLEQAIDAGRNRVVSV